MSDSSRIDLTALIERAKQTQSNAQRDFAEMHADGYSGDGLVRATVSGDGHLQSLHIDTALIDPEDPTSLTEAVIAAVGEAHAAAAELRAGTMNTLVKELGDVVAGLRAENAFGTVQPLFRTGFPPAGAAPAGGAG